MAADLIIYAIVAAGLIFWLRSILGTRHGDERERPNPFAGDAAAPRDANAPALEPLQVQPSLEDRLAILSGNKNGVTGVGNKTAEQALIEIARADKSFEIDFFLQAAQDAFVIVTEAFGAGDRETLRDLLDDPVYHVFDSAIAAREKNGEMQKVEIQAVRRAEIIEARLDGKNAFITLRFKADEVSWTKNAAGDILAGHETKATEMRDIWTFRHDLRGKDPRWLVTETRGGFEDDNDLIPNAG